MENFARTLIHSVISHYRRQINRWQCGSCLQKISINIVQFSLFFLSFTAFLFSYSTIVQAEAIQLEPAFQEIVLKDEQYVTGSVQIHNISDIPQTFEVFALDIRQQDEKGQIAFVDKPLSGTAFTLAGFIEIQDKTITLEPQAQKEVQFTIRNSVDLSPGGHYGAIIARVQNQSDIPADQKILPALSSLLLIHKQGGEQYQLSLAPLKLAEQGVVWQLPLELDLLFSNQGNVHVTPRGTINIKDVFGRLVYKGIINESSLFVLPQSKREVTVKLTSVASSLPFSIYFVEVDGTSEPGDTHFYQSFSLVSIEPKILILIIIILIMGLYGFKRYRTSKRNSFKKIV